MLHILELQGVVAGSLKETAKATRAFQLMLTIDPTHKVKGDHPPRVMTPFYEARGRVAEQGHLELKPDLRVEGDRVKEIRLTLRDPMGIARRVRLFWRLEKSARWTSCEADSKGGVVSCPVDGPVVLWWAQVTNEVESSEQAHAARARPSHCRAGLRRSGRGCRRGRPGRGRRLGATAELARHRDAG